MNKIVFFVIALCMIGLSENNLQAASRRKTDDCRLFMVLPAEVLFSNGQRAMEFGNWYEAIKNFNSLLKYHQDSSLIEDAYYYLGKSYYRMQEYEFANEAFTDYLKFKSNPKFFEEVLAYKFSIAEHFRGGVSRRPFAAQYLPKWLSGYEISLGIYDEVIAAMPSHELAALSYFYKGCLLWKMREYHDSVESYQTFIRRFPKHELAPQAYLNITKVYLEQSRREFQNSDLLAFAEVNVKKFRSEFPRDENVDIAEQEVARIKEVYACGLYETAYFYERIGKPRASLIYYEKAILQFPTTRIAGACRSRLSCMAPNTLEQIDLQLQAQLEAENAPEMLDADEKIDFSEEDFSLERR